MTPAETVWLDRFSGLASSEGSGPWDEEYSQEMEARFIAHNPNAVADRIYQSMGHGATQISAAVNDGRFWLVHRAWKRDELVRTLLLKLQCGCTHQRRLAFIMDVSCSNGSFTGSSDCFAERWMKNAGKGAVGNAQRIDILFLG